MVDPVASSACPASAIAHRDRCLRLCALPVSIFAKGTLAYGGYGLPRGPLSYYRAVVLHLMWTTPGPGGMYFSSPDIGRACGLGHSTVVEAVRRLARNTDQPFPHRNCDGSPAAVGGRIPTEKVG